MSEKITRDQAKELIDECDFGVILVADVDMEAVPTLGTVEIENREIRVEPHIDVYSFGIDD